MDPGMVGVFIPVLALGGGFALVALKMTLSHIREAREHNHVGAGAQQEVERLVGAVDELSAEVESLRGECRELNERVDFTERLLEPPKTGETAPDGSSPVS